MNENKNAPDYMLQSQPFPYVQLFALEYQRDYSNQSVPFVEVLDPGNNHNFQEYQKWIESLE